MGRPGLGACIRFIQGIVVQAITAWIRCNVDRKETRTMFTTLGIRLGGMACIMVCGALLAGCPCPNVLQVHNNTFVPITEVYLKFQVQDDYGDNRIDGNILPSETENIGNLAPGRYDVKLVYLGGAEAEAELEVLCDETITLDADGDS